MFTTFVQDAKRAADALAIAIFVTALGQQRYRCFRTLVLTVNSIRMAYRANGSMLPPMVDMFGVSACEIDSGLKSGTPKLSSEQIVKKRSPGNTQAIFGRGEDPHRA